MRTLTKHSKAFTMIELVFVIVVLGILAALALPRMERDIRQEAADNILSAIRYTQHLALNDDKTNPFDPVWQKTLWHIRFSLDGAGRYFYTVASNMDHGTNVDQNETAIDPANGKYLYNEAGTAVIDPDESPNIFIGKLYGIDSVDFSNCQTIANNVTNASTHIAFDQLGRPHKGVFGVATNDYRTVTKADCTITFGFQDGSDPLSIGIIKETGHAYIVGQDTL
ncbi:MAG TPA: type II secretion system protein [Sulfurovum sp.]|jgi:prepilin-type N-terminal cleavage/methylation domain-containing protein|nr:MAG: hypothetical protein B7Y63_03430 [Sulfurovum sp. 35-42-20]OYY57385.1 MAG: hypothetical protein B7Y52_01250 [Sulfurovum sp. 28-43-6]OYZ24425.1 MAG: hypothetical protein B7Y23_09095 [Sulfurovum sp. 16-42-52]OYZ49694.1 MAG: hypothetical protein B7Y13_03755 [Sulfurovum sp. 24-42-9]OZA44043.1 MAG: hypothetical protein B7X80_08400 [Sulfurovum sp. 17-42-90]OZA59440.1 MAG: hypothetical protein B7X69_07995 [Sulfurovum sp. 39-42-12]HQR73487.1 type II secretion system protein [Sulfurovum sp.]